MSVFLDAMRSVDKNDFNNVKLLIEMHPELITLHDLDENGDGNTLLHEAAFCNHYEVMSELLLHGADPNVHNLTGDTPLHIAAIDGDSRSIELLLSYGANPNIYNQEGYTALHFAAGSGGSRSQEIVSALIKCGATIDLNAAVRLNLVEQVASHLGANDEGLRAAPMPHLLLRDAIRLRSPVLVRMILDAGADPNDCRSGNHPLAESFLGLKPDLGIIKQLLLAGADPDLKDHRGVSARDEARNLGVKDVLEILEQQDAL